MAVTGTYAPDPFFQVLDSQGHPLSGGKISTYVAGSYTYATTYSDVNLSVANTNPVILDAAGRPTSGAIFLTPGQTYKFVLQDALGTFIGSEKDNIQAVPTSLKNAQFGIQTGPDFSTSVVTPTWADFGPMKGSILTRGGAVLAEAVFPGYISGVTPPGGAYFQWNLDGADLGVIAGVCTNTTATMIALQWSFTGLAVTTHQIKLRVALNSAGTFTAPMQTQAAGSFSLLEVNV
jgi:hypothetical protein